MRMMGFVMTFYAYVWCFQSRWTLVHSFVSSSIPSPFLYFTSLCGPVRLIRVVYRNKAEQLLIGAQTSF